MRGLYELKRTPLISWCVDPIYFVDPLTKVRSAAMGKVERPSNSNAHPLISKGRNDEWEDAGEAVADELWGGCKSSDTFSSVDPLSVSPATISPISGTPGSTFSSTEGISLVETPRSLALTVLDEFELFSLEEPNTGTVEVEPGTFQPSSSYLSISNGQVPSTGSSFILRRPSRLNNAHGGKIEWEDDARDLDIIGRHMKLTLDEESEMLKTPSGRREWIRREMLRRESHFTKRRALSIKSGSWNVGGVEPKVSLSAWLLPGDCNVENGADVYLVGFQEVQPLAGMSAVTTDGSRGTAYTKEVEKTLDCPNSYVIIAARQMVGILLVVAVKQIHEPFVRNVMLSDVGTGFMRSGGNKGSVACSFSLYDRTISFVNAHFAAHEHNVERRNEDFHHCMQRTSFLPSPGLADEPSPFSYLENDNSKPQQAGLLKKKSSILSDQSMCAGEPCSRASALDFPVQHCRDRGAGILNHDAVFWVGDLNYRLELPIDSAIALIEAEKYTELIKHDQLRSAREKGEVFQGFEEGTLNFAPTYKLSRKSSEYEKKEIDGEMKVARTPSWTDRVLWRDRTSSNLRAVGTGACASVRTKNSLFSKRSLPGRLGIKTDPSTLSNADGSIKLLHYQRVELLSSDHRPVFADFVLDFRIIDIKKRNDVVRQLHKDLSRREAALRPLLSLSVVEVNFGVVKYGEIVSTKHSPLVLRNEGRVSAIVAIPCTNIPAWLSVESGTSDLVLSPGASVDIAFTALVTAHLGVSPALNLQKASLRTDVRLILQNQDELAVPVVGHYVPTCLGNTLSLLTYSLQPIARKESFALVTPLGKPPALPVPKEIWRIIDFLHGALASLQKGSSSINALTKEASDLRALFAAHCNSADVVTAQICVDTGKSFPGCLQPAAAGTCLLNILSSLEEPAIPARCSPSCLAAGQKALGTVNQQELITALEGASAASINTVVYLCSFLSKLPGPIIARKECWSSLGKSRYMSEESFDGFPSPKALSQIFAAAFFGVDDADEKARGEKAAYVLHLIHSGDQGQLHAVFASSWP